MNNRILFTVALLSAAVLVLGVSLQTALAQQLSPQEQLGRNLYFDETLSEPAGQGCVSCHHPDFGFADPDRNLPVSEGVILNRFGTRNSPSAAYAAVFPEFTLKGGIQGGQFWDGRAANLTEQAKGPFLNPVEMNNTSEEQVIAKICARPYVDLFETICGPDACNTDNTDTSYHCMAESIAAFEGTSELNKFTSKFDEVQAGREIFTQLEEEGRALYNGKGKCGHCHPAKAGGGRPVVFTDFKYHNIGVPKNSGFPFTELSPDFVDLGLGGFLNDPRQNGRFKTTHLRNIELTPPFMHNGVIKTLKEVVHFYNTRDVLPMCDAALGSEDPNFGTTCWPPPELAENMDSSFVGDLGLTDAEEDAIVEFMLTFTDGFVTQ